MVFRWLPSPTQISSSVTRFLISASGKPAIRNEKQSKVVAAASAMNQPFELSGPNGALPERDIRPPANLQEAVERDVMDGRLDDRQLGGEYAEKIRALIASLSDTMARIGK